MTERQIVIPRGLIDVRAAPVGESVRTASMPILRAAVSPTELKALQRRAFERGREVERHESARSLEAATHALEAAAEGLQAARGRDREDVQEFCVQLAVMVAEELLHRNLDEQLHDVRQMVRRALDDALKDLQAERVSLSVSPADRALLPQGLEEERPGVSLSVLSDPTLEPGSFRVSVRGAEYYSGLSERLTEIKNRLMEETRNATAPRS